MSETIAEVNNEVVLTDLRRKKKDNKLTPDYNYNAIKKYREVNKDKINEYQKNYERNRREKQKQEKLEMEEKIKSLEAELAKIKLENEELKKTILDGNK